MNRLRGLAELVQDAVQHGTIAVEKVHQSVARTPLEVLALVPPLTATALWMADAQSRLIAASYRTIREASAAAGALAGTCIEAAERARRPPA